MKRSRRVIAGALVGGGILSAGLATLAAAPASADVPDGKYHMTDSLSAGSNDGANVTLHDGNKLRIPTLGDVPFHQTKDGGYASVGAVSYIFTKKGDTYSGPIRFGPLTVGTSTLTPIPAAH